MAAATLAGIATLILAGMLAILSARIDAPGGTLHTRCVEDMGCWDCRTMGNRICGEGR